MRDTVAAVDDDASEEAYINRKNVYDYPDSDREESNGLTRYS